MKRKYNSIQLTRLNIILMLCAVMSITTGCKSKKNTTPTEYTSEKGIFHTEKITRQQQRILDEAYTWLGTPYKYAGAEKGEGTDCSGMVMRVYEDVTGCKIPRNSAKQAEFCTPLNEEDVAIGDLVFFATGKDPDRVSHVGIVVENDKFIHASTSKGVVISDIFSPYYRRTFKMFGRVKN